MMAITVEIGKGDRFSERKVFRSRFCQYDRCSIQIHVKTGYLF